MTLCSLGSNGLRRSRLIIIDYLCPFNILCIFIMHIYHLFPLEERVWMNFLQNLSNSIRTRPDRRQSPRRLIWSDKLCTRKGHKTDYLTSSTPPLSLSLGQILGIEFFFSLTPTVVWGWWWSSCPWLYPFYFMTRYWVFHGHGRCGTMSTNEFIHSQFYQCDAVHIIHMVLYLCVIWWGLSYLSDLFSLVDVLCSHELPL